MVEENCLLREERASSKLPVDDKDDDDDERALELGWGWAWWNVKECPPASK